MNFHPIENSYQTAIKCVPLLMQWHRPRSVLDLGCNVGWWLKAFNEHGVNDVVGIDGGNMLDALVIDRNKFHTFDLTKELNLGRKFDLVICLEVAEHISEQYADTLIQSCVNHSDMIFWSAANKGQGGYNHVNEQQPEYWIEKFGRKGFDSMIMKDALPELPHEYYRTNALQIERR